MKKIAFLAGAFFMMMISVACSSEETKEVAEKKEVASYPTKTNFRFVDMDSVAEHYNLAKDYKEWLLKETGTLESKIKGAYASAAKFEKECQVKAQNNGYLTEASYNEDLKKLQNMVANAQKQEQEYRNQANIEDIAWQKQIKDSIDSYLENYNKSHKYDAILDKKVGLYWNPSLDITDSIIDGLNKRYTKVAK